MQNPHAWLGLYGTKRKPVEQLSADAEIFRHFRPSLACARVLADPARRAFDLVEEVQAEARHRLYGDVHKTERTRTSRLWINPVMSLCWCFDLDAVARRSLYLHELADTQRMFDVVAIIEGLRKQWAREGKIRSRQPIPV